MATQSKNKTGIPVTGINQHGTNTITGVAFVNTPDLKTLSGDSNSPLFDKERLSRTKDNRLTRRIYFYVKDGTTMPLPDGQGEYVYIADINGLYNPDLATESAKQEIAEMMADHSTNEWESAILDAGYYGYVTNGLACFLDGKVKVQYLGNIHTVKAQGENPTETPTDLPSANLQSSSSSTKPLPKPKKTIKTQKTTAGITDTQKPVVEAVSSSDTGIVGDVNSSSNDVMQSIKSVLLSEEFTTNLAGKISTAIMGFNRAVKEFEATESSKDVAITNPEKIDIESGSKKQTKVEKLLEEIRQILKIMKDGNSKDVSKGQQRLEEIMTETSSFSKETHEFFTKSINDIFREINGSAKKKEVEPIEKKKNTVTVNDSLTKFDPLASLPKTGIDITETPTDFAVPEKTPTLPKVDDVAIPTTIESQDVKKVEPEQKKSEFETKPTTPTLPKVDDVEEPTVKTPTKVKKVEPEQKKSDFAVPEKTPTLPKVDDVEEPTVKTPTKVKKSKKVKPSPETPTPPVIPKVITGARPLFADIISKKSTSGKRLKNQRESFSYDDDNTVLRYRPAYREMPKELKGIDKVLGAMINRNKNVRTKNADGSYTTTPGANKIGYTKALLRGSEKYLKKGEAAKTLRALSFRKKPPIVKIPPPSPNSTVGVKPSTPIFSPSTNSNVPQQTSPVVPAVQPKSLIDQAIDLAAPVGLGAMALGKMKKFAGFAKGRVGSAVGTGLLAAGADYGAGALGIAGGNKIDDKEDDSNWNKMSLLEKAESSLPRGIEKAGSFLGLNNFANEAKSKRIKTESEYIGKGPTLFNSITSPSIGLPVKASASGLGNSIGQKIRSSFSPKENKNGLEEPKVFPVPKKELSNNSDYLTSQAMKSDVAKSNTVSEVPQQPINIVNNNTSSAPVTQVMPNNPMTIRPLESSYSRFILNRVAG